MTLFMVKFMYWWQSYTWILCLSADVQLIWPHHVTDLSKTCPKAFTLGAYMIWDLISLSFVLLLLKIKKNLLYAILSALEGQFHDILDISRTVRNHSTTYWKLKLIGGQLFFLQPLLSKPCRSSHFLLSLFLTNSNTPCFSPRPKDSKMVRHSSVGSKMTELWLKTVVAEIRVWIGLILKSMKSELFDTLYWLLLAKTLMPHHIERVFSKIFQIGDGHCNAVPIKLKNNSPLKFWYVKIYVPRT